MFDLADDAQAARFDDRRFVCDRDLPRGRRGARPEFEGGYFLYRFSDPTYVVAHAVVRAVAGVVLRRGGAPSTSAAGRAT